MTIRTLNSRVMYRNPWMTVREDDIERDNGTRGIYGVVEKCDSAIILAIEAVLRPRLGQRRRRA